MLVLWVSVAILAGTVMAEAQGTVQFTTRSGSWVNAPVLYPGGGLVQGTGPNAILGQLRGGPVGGQLLPLGNAIPFRSDAGAGYILAGGEVAIPGTTTGGAAQVQLVAWYASLADNLETLLDLPMGIRICGYGESPVITVQPLAGGPLAPALLVGLQGFTVGSACPEPSALALGLLGAGLFLVSRKKAV